MYKKVGKPLKNNMQRWNSGFLKIKYKVYGYANTSFKVDMTDIVLTQKQQVITNFIRFNNNTALKYHMPLYALNY